MVMDIFHLEKNVVIKYLMGVWKMEYKGKKMNIDVKSFIENGIFET